MLHEIKLAIVGIFVAAALMNGARAVEAEASANTFERGQVETAEIAD